MSKLRDLLKTSEMVIAGPKYQSPDVLTDKTKVLARRAAAGSIQAPKLQRNVQNTTPQLQQRIMQPAAPSPIKLVDDKNLSPGRRVFRKIALSTPVGYATDKAFDYLQKRDINKAANTALKAGHFAGGLSNVLPFVPVEKAVLGENLPDAEKYRTYRAAGGMTGTALATALTGGGASIPQLAGNFSRIATMGGGIGGTLTAAQTLMSKGRLPTAQELLSGIGQGGLRALEQSPTHWLTNQVVNQAAANVPALKGLADEAISKALPSKGANLKQIVHGFADSALRRQLRAVLIETPYEALQYGIKGKEDNERVIDSIVREFKDNGIWNVAFAGSGTIGDMWSLRDVMKVALDESPTYKNTFGSERGSFDMSAFIKKDPGLKALSNLLGRTPNSGEIQTYRHAAETLGLKPEEVARVIQEGKVPALDDLIEAKRVFSGAYEGIDPRTSPEVKGLGLDIAGKTNEQVLNEIDGMVRNMLQGNTRLTVADDRTYIGATQATKGETAPVRLETLLHYPEHLRRMGYSNKMIDTISAKDAQRIIDEGIPPFLYPQPDSEPSLGAFDAPTNRERYRGQKRLKQPELSTDEVEQSIGRTYAREETAKGFVGWFNSVFNPIKNTPGDTQEALIEWRNGTLAGRARANTVAQEFAHIPEQDGWKLIRYIQDPTPAKARELRLDVNQYETEIRQLRSFYDAVRQEGIDAGLDIRYLNNYINQVWKETPDQIDAIIRGGAGRNPSFTKAREIPNYEEGMQIGLTPRYTHPAQLAAHYRYQLDRALVNARLVDGLLDTGDLLPANKAPVNWKSIESPFFPKATIMTRGGTTTVDYKAPPDIALALNNVFEVKEPGAMHLAADIARGIQEFRLSAGVPKTPLNSFAFANFMKEVLAGRVRGPVAATALSFSDNATRQYFNDNVQYTKMMAENGVPLYTNTDYSKMFDNLAESKSTRQMLGNLFNESFNEPTFRRFMPILQVEFFKDVYEGALKDGMDSNGAQELATQATKNFYGLSDNFTRAQNTEDTLNTLIMAPRFREAMVNFWGKTAASLSPQNLSKPEYSANRKFVAGSAILYVMYQLMNKALTGRWMHENKPGKELSLEIPKGGGRSFYLPFMFTLGTVPRRLMEGAGYLAGGDVAGAAERMGTFASIPLSTASALLSNRTFYGGPIYQEDDPALRKLSKLGGYALEQTMHPFIGEPIAVAQGRKSPDEAIPGLLELPLYPSASTETAHLRGKQREEFNRLYKQNPLAADQYARRMKAESDYKKVLKDLRAGKITQSTARREISKIQRDFYGETSLQGGSVPLTSGMSSKGTPSEPSSIASVRIKTSRSRRPRAVKAKSLPKLKQNKTPKVLFKIRQPNKSALSPATVITKLPRLG